MLWSLCRVINTQPLNNKHSLPRRRHLSTQTAHFSNRVRQAGGWAAVSFLCLWWGGGLLNRSASGENSRLSSGAPASNRLSGTPRLSPGGRGQFVILPTQLVDAAGASLGPPSNPILGSVFARVVLHKQAPSSQFSSGKKRP